MGVTCWAYLVDWNELEQRAGQSASEADIQQAIDDDEPWLDRYSAKTWNDSGNAMMDFINAFDQIVERIPDPEVRYLRQFFGPLGALADENGSHCPQRDGSITKTSKESPLYASLAPQTLRRVLAAFEAISWPEIHKACRRATFEEGYIQSFEDFKTYVESWADLVRAAVQENRGVLLYAA